MLGSIYMGSKLVYKERYECLYIVRCLVCKNKVCTSSDSVAVSKQNTFCDECGHNQNIAYKVKYIIGEKLTAYYDGHFPYLEDTIKIDKKTLEIALGMTTSNCNFYETIGQLQAQLGKKLLTHSIYLLDGQNIWRFSNAILGDYRRVKRGADRTRSISKPKRRKSVSRKSASRRKDPICAQPAPR